MTAEELSAAAAEQRVRLAARGVLPGDLLMYVAGNKPEWLALWLACRASGIVLMPVDAGTTASEIATLASTLRRDVRSSPGLADHAAAADLGTPAAVRASADLVANPDRRRGARRSLGDAAVLKLTSGSTGLPKATFTTEPQLVTDTEHIVQCDGDRPRRCPDGGDPAVARVRPRQSA